MTKINRKNAEARINEMLNRRTKMTETEFMSFAEEVKENCIADLKKYITGQVVRAAFDETQAHGVIGTGRTTYADIEILTEAEIEEEIEEEIAAEIEVAEKNTEQKAPRAKVVKNYTKVNGKTYNAANMISASRRDQMEAKGYELKDISYVESAQEAYNRLAETFKSVRIYSYSKKVNGTRYMYAMCK